MGLADVPLDPRGRCRTQPGRALAHHEPGGAEQGRDLPEDYRRMMEAAWGPVRVLAAAERAHGSEVVLPLYTAIGEAFHLRGQERTRETIETALATAGLPVELAAVMTDPAYDEELRASTAVALTRVCLLYTS